MHYRKAVNVYIFKRMFCLVYLQFHKYAVPFLLCGRVLKTEDEVSETTVETSKRVSPS